MYVDTEVSLFIVPGIVQGTVTHDGLEFPFQCLESSTFLVRVG